MADIFIRSLLLFGIFQRLFHLQNPEGDLHDRIGVEGDGADGKAVEEPAELVDKDDVVGDLTHDVDVQPVHGEIRRPGAAPGRDRRSPPLSAPAPPGRGPGDKSCRLPRVNHQGKTISS